MSIEVMKQALEVLEHKGNIYHIDCKSGDAITALRAAIAEASMQRLTDVQQEMECNCKASDMPFGRCCKAPTPRREWVGLTDEDIAMLDWESFATKRDCVQAIEAKLKEKNT
jgi:hypothetical protein